MTEFVVDPAFEEISVPDLEPRHKYQLLTSIVVPRPIGWISTYGTDGTPNLAPFSYYAAISHSPMLVGVSIGHRRTGPKDTLVNIRHQSAFCANLVTEAHLESMNATSGDYPPARSEFEATGLEPSPAAKVNAPFVKGAPVVMECRVFQEVDLGEAPNTLVIGEVVQIRVHESVPRAPDTEYLDSAALAPVGRLWGPTYAGLGHIRQIPRPQV